MVTPHKRPGRFSRTAILLCACIILCTPMLIQGEVLYLKDGSTIRGSVVEFVQDTLTFDTTFGSRIKVARARITKIVFSDSVAAEPGVPGLQRSDTGPSGTAGGNGFLAVTFEDKKISSKVVVHNKKNKKQLIEANWVVQSIVVDGNTVFTLVDSTMDKTINKGHDKIIKNNVELKDMNVALGAGLYSCVVLVRNQGLGIHDEEFDNDPLDLTLNLDNIQIFPGRTTRIQVGINKGKLRLGKPRLYRVQ